MVTVVCSYVKRMNANPVLAVLTPFIKVSGEGLYLNVLPFREDFRDFQFASLDDKKQSTVDAGHIEAARALVRAMDLENAKTDKDGYGYFGLLIGNMNMTV